MTENTATEAVFSVSTRQCVGSSIHSQSFRGLIFPSLCSEQYSCIENLVRFLEQNYEGEVWVDEIVAGLGTLQCMSSTRKRAILLGLVLGAFCVGIFVALSSKLPESNVVENTAPETVTEVEANAETAISDDICPEIDVITESFGGDWTDCLSDQRMAVAWFGGKEFEAMGVTSSFAVTYTDVENTPAVMSELREKLLQDGWSNGSGSITVGDTVATYSLMDAGGPLSSQEIFVKHDDEANTMQFIGLIEETHITGEFLSEEEVCPCTKEIQLFMSKEHTFSLRNGSI